MPTFTPFLGEHQRRGAISQWLPELGWGFIQSLTGEVVRVTYAARQAGGWPSLGDDITYRFAVDEKFGDVVAVSLQMAVPRPA
ncbi:MAG: hypothetical protein WB764_10630 [Xanthobacteraceae bacterium]